MLSWIFIVLAHWNNSLGINISLHSDTLSWFRANQSLFLLLNAACLAEKQQYQFHSLWFDQIGARSHDLPHSRRARYPLHHRCCKIYWKFIIYLQPPNTLCPHFTTPFCCLPNPANKIYWRLSWQQSLINRLSTLSSSFKASYIKKNEWDDFQQLLTNFWGSVVSWTGILCLWEVFSEKYLLRDNTISWADRQVTRGSQEPVSFTW
jgi:hypothetical protein